MGRFFGFDGREGVEVLGSNVGIGERLDDLVALPDQEVADFVVHGDDGPMDVFGEAPKGWGDGFGDGEVTADYGVDLVLDPLK